MPVKPRAGLHANTLGERLEAAVTATLDDWRAGIEQGV